MTQEEQVLQQQASQQQQAAKQQPSVQPAPLLEEESSGIDIVEWIFRILHHWYLFAIAGIIAFSLAYLKNRKVMETYLTTGTMIIQESPGGGYGTRNEVITTENDQLVIDIAIARLHTKTLHEGRIAVATSLRFLDNHRTHSEVGLHHLAVLQVRQ